MKQVLVFNLGKEFIACEVGAVHEIIQYQEITPLPGMQHYVEGVTNVRGVVYPVISLARRLGNVDSPLTKASRIIIVEVDGCSVGIVVDNVTEVLKVEEGMEVSPPSMVSGSISSALISIIKDSDRLISFIDVSKIIDPNIADLVIA